MFAPVTEEGAGVYYSTKGVINSLKAYDEISLSTFVGIKRRNNFFNREELYSEVNITRAYGPGNFLWAPGMGSDLKKFRPNIIHLHGLWMYQSLLSLRFKNIPKVISTHGQLDFWALRNSNLKKRLAYFLYERKNLSTANCIHALNENELNSIREFGLKNPVAVIPNGVEGVIPSSINFKTPQWKEQIPENAKVLLFLGRVHRQKGVDLLLHSWANYLKKIKGNGLKNRWHLVIAGSGEKKYLIFLKKLQRELGIELSSHFVGHLNESEKFEALHVSDAFVLPSRSEGLPMAVLEACSFGLPVLITKKCNLDDIVSSDAGIMIPENEDFSSSLIKLTLKSEQELNIISKNARKLIVEKYNWLKISQDYLSLYKWLINGDNIPNFVIKD